MEKRMETIFPPNNKLVQEPGEMKKTDAQIQTPMKQR
jgi:hypothetical protein